MEKSAEVAYVLYGIWCNRNLKVHGSAPIPAALVAQNAKKLPREFYAANAPPVITQQTSTTRSEEKRRSPPSRRLKINVDAAIKVLELSFSTRRRGARLPKSVTTISRSYLLLDSA
ncbi:hypothetical protein Droror1_Dr00016338 [Drosera rotundifolia]